MQVIILCSGPSEKTTMSYEGFYGPLVDIAGRPVLWHVMNQYSRFGYKEFIVCLDFDRNPIKDYFLKYETMHRDFELILGEPDSLRFLSDHDEKEWHIMFIHADENNASGSMVMKAKKNIKSDNFIVTYGDRLTRLDIVNFLGFHKKCEKTGTSLVVRSYGRTRKTMRGNAALAEFIDKKGLRPEFINGGIFIFNRNVFDNSFGKSSFSLEEHVAARLIKDDELSLYVYDGFWQQLDSEREATQLRNNTHVLGR